MLAMDEVSEQHLVAADDLLVEQQRERPLGHNLECEPFKSRLTVGLELFILVH